MVVTVYTIIISLCLIAIQFHSNQPLDTHTNRAQKSLKQSEFTCHLQCTRIHSYRTRGMNRSMNRTVTSVYCSTPILQISCLKCKVLSLRAYDSTSVYKHIIIFLAACARGVSNPNRKTEFNTTGRNEESRRPVVCPSL